MNPIGDIYTGVTNGLREIWANKVRALLSMSGIILGVAALVSMVGIVQGMLSTMRSSFEQSGGVLKLEVHPTAAPESQQHIAGISPGLTWRDIIAIESSTPLARYTTPIVDMGWERFAANGEREGAMMDGVNPEHNNIETKEIEFGRFISDTDIKLKSPVMVIGSHLREELFPDLLSAVGEQIILRDQVYTVVGQFKPIGSFGGQGKRFNYENRKNYMPATTAMSRYNGNDSIDEIHIIAYKREELPDLMSQIENTLTRTHRGIKDFEIRTQEERLQELRKLENSFIYSLGGIAGISLIVGGIGIMNVMLASVSERIREIGVRKAIGARSYDIFIQFLVESIATSVLGGIVGLGVSVGLLSLAQDLIPQGESISIFPVSAMFYGFLFSCTIGLLSGIYPAMRAARLDPIDALRYE
ncbi:MAG: ABC transporter permease [Opitutaceae bacterium]